MLTCVLCVGVILWSEGNPLFGETQGMGVTRDPEEDYPFQPGGQNFIQPGQQTPQPVSNGPASASLPVSPSSLSPLPHTGVTTSPKGSEGSSSAWGRGLHSSWYWYMEKTGTEGIPKQDGKK